MLVSVHIKIFKSLSFLKISAIWSFFLIFLFELMSFKVPTFTKPIFNFSYFMIFLSFVITTFSSSSFDYFKNSLIFFIISSKFNPMKSILRLSLFFDYCMSNSFFNFVFEIFFSFPITYTGEILVQDSENLG